MTTTRTHAALPAPSPRTGRYCPLCGVDSPPDDECHLWGCPVLLTLAEEYGRTAAAAAANA